MRIMVYSLALLWVMRDLDHQPYQCEVGELKLPRSSLMLKDSEGSQRVFGCFEVSGYRGNW